MKDLLKSLVDATSKANVEVQIEELNKILDVSYVSDRESLCEYSTLKRIIDSFPERDSVDFEIRDTTDDGVCLGDSASTPEENYNDFIEKIMDGEELTVTLHVEKTTRENKLSIYCIKEFCSYFLNLSMLEMLKFVEEDLGDEDQIVFEVLDSELFMATTSMVFRPYGSTSSVKSFDRKKKMEECHKNCYIFWTGQHLPIPEDFHVVMECDENPFSEVFRKIETMLSLVYIADNVHFQEESISCQLYGKRMSTISVAISDIKYNPVLYDIYYWMYTEGNVVDKVTLARNLLSLHCKYVALNDLDEQTFMSIKANFSIYQKENVDKYIEVKNKMTEYLTGLIGESRDIVLSIVNDIGKNIIAFFSFILTVFISGIMSEKGLEGIFTREVTVFSYLICVCSLVYVAITHFITNFKVGKLRDSYNMLKENNDFLKDTKEFEEVFDDHKIEKTIKEINKNRIRLIVLWVIMILLVFIVVSVLSNYGASKWIDSFLKLVKGFIK